MSYKCAICRKSFVNQPGDICVSCQMKQPKPNYMTPPGSSPASGQGSVPNYAGGNDPVGKMPQYNTPPTGPATPPPYDAGYENAQQPAAKKGEYSGIIQNLMTNPISGTLASRWINSLIHGMPFSTGNNQSVFSIFSQDAYAGAGVGGHSVMFYGNADYSFLSNNAPVVVHGQKMSDGVILANTIEGSNFGFKMKARFSLSALWVRLITLLVVALLVFGGAAAVNGVSNRTAASRTEQTVTENDETENQSSSGRMRTTTNPRTMLLGIALLAIGGLLLFKSSLISKKISLLICFIGAGLIYPLLMVLLIVLVILWLFLKIK